MSKSKLAIIGVIVLLMLAIIGIGVVIKSRTAQPSEDKVEKRVEPVNQIPIAQRPFIRMYPRQDGREITIEVNQLESYPSVEYELEYEAGSLLQGAFGTMDFTTENPPVKRNLLLGSCSAGGKCSYHEDVNGGTLTLRYKNGDSVKLKGEWNFQLFGEREGLFTSRDAKFSLKYPELSLPDTTFAMIYQTFGLPAPVEGKLLAGPYAVSLAEGIVPKLKNDKLVVSLHLSDISGNPTVLQWDGDSWEEKESTIADQSIKAEVETASTFIVVQPAPQNEE